MIKNISIKLFKGLSISELLLLIYPLTLVTGPFAPDLLVVISSFFFIFFFIKKKISNFDFLKKYTLLFFLISIFSSLYNYDFYRSLKSLADIRFFLFIMFICFILKNNQKIIKKLFYLTLLLLIFIILDSYLQLALGTNILGMKKTDPIRLSGIFGEEFVLGGFLLKLSPLLFYFSSNNKTEKKLSLIFFLVFVEPLIFFSGQRGPFIMSIILIFGMFLINFKNRIFYLCIIYLIIVIGGNLFFNKKYYDRYIFDIVANFKYNNDVKIKNQSEHLNFSIVTPSHTKLFLSAYNIFLDNKFFGSGTNSFRHECKKYNTCSTHPHNYYIQILAENGIFNFILLLSFYFFLMKEFFITLYKILFFNKKKIINSYYLILNLLIVLFPLQTTGNFFNNYVLGLSSFILGLYFFNREIEK